MEGGENRLGRGETLRGVAARMAWQVRSERQWTFSKLNSKFCQLLS